MNNTMAQKLNKLNKFIRNLPTRGRFVIQRVTGSKSKLFFLFCLIFILGAGAYSVFYDILGWQANFFWLYGSLLISALAAILTLKKPYRLLVLAVCVFALGMMRFGLSLPNIDENHIADYNGQTVILEGVVSNEPDIRLGNAKYELRVLSLQATGNPKSSASEKAEGLPPTAFRKAVGGKVLATTDLYPEYKYGDKLRIKCELQEPGTIEDFDYGRYLSRYNIYSVCYWPKEIEFLEQGQGNAALAGLFKIKDYFSRTTAKILPEPESSLLGGILYGARRTIPEELMESFNRAGITHIIAISGYNITILVTMLSYVFVSAIGRRRAFLPILAGVLFFTLISGVSASVVRAAIMGGIAALAKQAGRMSNVKNVLILAAVLMVLLNPKILLFDAGFQLSFAATLGLVYLSPVITRMTRTQAKDTNTRTKNPNIDPRADDSHRARHPPAIVYAESIGGHGRPDDTSGRAGIIRKFGAYLKPYAVETTSAIILTLPLILYYFGRLSLVALLANILILPWIPATMLIGFLSVTAGMIWIQAGKILGLGAWLFLKYSILVSVTLSKLPFASIDFGRVSWFMALIFYCLIIVWLLKKRRQFQEERAPSREDVPVKLPLKKKLFYGFSGTCLAVLILISASFLEARAGNKLNVVFLDVGQGDAALIQKTDKQILIDGGPDNKILSELGKYIPFYDRKIEMMILSHAHTDHFIGLIDILRRYEVEQIILNCADGEGESYQIFKQEAKKEGAEMICASSGSKFVLGDINLVTLWPPVIFSEKITGRPEEKGGLNDTSLVIRIEHEKNSVLFTGDISDEVENKLIALDQDDNLNILDADILKVAHHGSKFSTSQEFLEKVKPKYAVVGVGEKNWYGHPSYRVIKRLERNGIKVFRTDKNGNIEFFCGKEGCGFKR